VSMLWSQFFGDFCRFSAKKWRFLKNQYYDQIFLHNLALLWVKNAIFVAIFFGENIFKIITSVPEIFYKLKTKLFLKRKTQRIFMLTLI
jgi:hypothetical protein